MVDFAVEGRRARARPLQGVLEHRLRTGVPTRPAQRGVSFQQCDGETRGSEKGTSSGSLGGVF